MKIGDTVRFLSEVGGGKVIGFKGKNIVLVEDEDGFEMPFSVNDVVVIGNEDYSVKNVINNSSFKPAVTNFDKEIQKETISNANTFINERSGGDRLSAYLAFVPINAQELSTTRFEAYIINDSNYFMYYVYMTAESVGWKVRSKGCAEPNTKLFVEEFGREELNDIERVSIQIITYKLDKTFILKPVIDVQLRIDCVKFYKLHTFQENDFFEQNALIYPIIENDKPVRPLVINSKDLRHQMMSKKENYDKAYQTAPSVIKTDKDVPVVVDLHIEKLLDTTAGLKAIDILNYQLDTFRNTLKLYEKQKGKKIIFIHGKGEGVLRQALINDMQYRYKHYTYQDASFQEYGYGATQVTIK